MDARCHIDSALSTWGKADSPAASTFAPAETPETKEDIAAYLDAVLEDGDPDLLKAVLGDIARAKGMTEIAQAAGVWPDQSLRGGAAIDNNITEIADASIVFVTKSSCTLSSSR